MYQPITPAIEAQLSAIAGRGNVLKEKDALADYAHDEFALAGMAHYPDLVVRPGTAGEVARIAALADRERIPLVPRGGGTGLCGGCVPVLGGIVLDMSRLNRVLEIDPANFMVTVEAGVTLAQFYAALEKEHLFFPPHPGDEFAMFGGLIAANAGGARAVKYGTIRNFVRGVQAVLPSGDMLNLGGKVMKDSSGYHLLQLLIGSEGTLGIITKAIISVMPPREIVWTLVVPYADLNAAAVSSEKILQAGLLPMALEFLEDDVVAVAEEFLGKKWPGRGARAYLMIMMDGKTEEEVARSVEPVAEICLANQAGDVFVANTKQKQTEILYIRSQLYEALKSQTIEILDAVVPRSEIARHVAAVKEIGARYRVWLPTYGHAADGNVHTHIMKTRFADGRMSENTDDWTEYYPKIKEAIHADAVGRGGRISGEHGIGLAKKDLLRKFLPGNEIVLMQAIKRCFDPNNILNPGKIF